MKKQGGRVVWIQGWLGSVSRGVRRELVECITESGVGKAAWSWPVSCCQVLETPSLTMEGGHTKAKGDARV